ncbi:MAG: hypothetical protein ACOY0T_00455 [Myxococcota bacterium]
MIESTRRATLLLTMTAFSNARMVSAVSKLLSEFCRCLVDDPDVAARFYMVAQELAENLMKYSSGSNISVSAELLSQDGALTLRLEARNRTTPERLRAAELHLRELTSAKDPVALYDRLILETAPKLNESGLGLARIRAEGGFNLNYRIDGDELTVSVDTPV